jgi:hypothetical protein
MPCTSKQIIELSELDYEIEKKLEEQKDDDDEYIDLAVIQSILAEEQTKTNDLDSTLILTQENEKISQISNNDKPVKCILKKNVNKKTVNFV